MVDPLHDIRYDQVHRSGWILPVNYVYSIRSVGYGSNAKPLTMAIDCCSLLSVWNVRLWTSRSLAQLEDVCVFKINQIF